MRHLVQFRTGDGKPGVHFTDSLEDAVRFVEHLRNNEQTTDVLVFSLQEVPIEFKVQYKVEIGAPGAGGPAAPAPASSPAVESDGMAGEVETARGGGARPAEARVTGTEPDPNNGGRFGLFSKI